MRWPWQRRKARLQRPVSPDQVEDDDPFLRMVVAAAWEHGSAAATVDEDGNFEMHPLDDQDEQVSPPE